MAVDSEKYQFACSTKAIGSFKECRSGFKVKQIGSRVIFKNTKVITILFR
ncbi:hypothetical protein [Algibacter sp. R77976]